MADNVIRFRAMLAGIVANFAPEAVPVLGRHWGMDTVGWLQGILPVGTDLWFTARIDEAGAVARLRRGPVPVSLEMAGRGVQPRSDEPDIVMPVVLPSAYRGRYGATGWTLTAVAILPEWDRPAARGSALWVDQ